MKILITGARGMLGTELVRVLAAAHEVVALGHAELDVTNGAQARRVIGEAKPQVVVQAAAMTKVDDCELDPARAYAVNAAGARHVAEACAASGSRLVLLSTDYVFAGLKGAPYTEEDDPEPMNVYGASKLAGEDHVREVLPERLIVRTAWLFGAARDNFIEWVLRKSQNAATLEAVADQAGSPTYAADLAEILRALIERGARGMFHVTNAGSCSWRTFAEEILRREGRNCTVVPIQGKSLGRPAARPANTALASGRLASVGLAPLRSWQEATAAYLERRGK